MFIDDVLIKWYIKRFLIKFYGFFKVIDNFINYV